MDAERGGSDLMIVPSAACILGASFAGTTVETAVLPSLARIRHNGAEPSGFSLPFLLGLGTSVRDVHSCETSAQIRVNPSFMGGTH